VLIIWLSLAVVAAASIALAVVVAEGLERKQGLRSLHRPIR